MIYTLSCIILLLVIFHRISFGFLPEYGNKSIAIRFEYYSAFETEIEKLISRLEEEYMGLKGITEVFSMAEVGKGYILCKFSDKTNLDDAYLQVSDATSFIYSDFPGGVNRSEIIKSGIDDKPVFIASFKKNCSFETEQIKKMFSAHPDAGEVEIGGETKKELLIQADIEKLSQMGMSLDDVNKAIWKNNLTGAIILPEGQNLVQDSRCISPADFETLWLSDKNRLKDIAIIEHRFTQRDNIAHIDGEENLLVYVKKAGDGNTIRLCNHLKKLSNCLGARIIYNKGEKITKALLMTISIAVIGLVLIFYILWQWKKDLHYFSSLLSEILFSTISSLFIVSVYGFQTDITVILALVILYICLISTSILSINLKYSLTILLLFLPLLFVPQKIQAISAPFSMAFGTGLLSSFIFKSIFKKLLSGQTSLRTDYKQIFMKIASLGAISSIAIVLLVFYFTSSEENSFNMEFETGTSFDYVKKTASEVEKYLLDWGKFDKITMHLENERASFDFRGVKKHALKEKINRLSTSYSDVFFYFPQKYQKKACEVVIYGDDLTSIKENITHLAEFIYSSNNKTEIVYNFKSDRNDIIFNISSKYAAKGISPYTVYRTLYNASTAPVVDKFIFNSNETDVKTCSLKKTSQSIYDILSIPIIRADGNYCIAGEFIKIQHENSPSKIYHRNRMREYSFSVLGLSKEELERLVSTFEFTDSCHAEIYR